MGTTINGWIRQKKWMHIVLAFAGSMISFLTNAQSTEDLIKLHQEKLRNLYGSRGMYEKDWPYSGAVSENDIKEVLGHYRKPVGMLWYLHQHDTLWVTGLRADAPVFRSVTHISADSLSYLVQMINRHFSFRNPAASLVNRAAEIENEKEIGLNERFESQFDELNALLFPFPNFFDSLKHLILVPALNFATLPFACFPLNDTLTLIDQMSFSIAPSLFEFMAMDYIRNQEKNEYQPYSNDLMQALFVSNPAYPKNTKWTFPDLPGAQREVSAIKALLDSSGFQSVAFKGSTATKKNVLAQICEFDLLYFATHGISDPENPLEGSFLVLSGKNGDSCFLTAREIQEWRHKCDLSANLVVLSACQTGLGKTHDAGIIGLARAFQIAGANDVMMSLWNIDDQKTAQLMEIFFKIYAQTGAKNPYESMRKAMLLFRDSVDRDPHFWAAFSIFGIP